MTSQRSEPALGDEQSFHEARRRWPADPEVNAKATHFLHSEAINPTGMHFGLMSYAVVSIYLHFSNIDRTEGWVTLGDHKFKDLSHLSWLVRSFAFCFLEWLAALVEQDRCPSKFRVNIRTGWANIVYATGSFSTMVLLMDITATVCYLIVEFWRLEIEVLDNSQQYSDIITNLFWWCVMIEFLVAAYYARRFHICMLSPLEGFIRAMKDQMRKERALERAAKTSTGESGTASDQLTSHGLSVLSADDLEKERDRTANSQEDVKALNSSIILHSGIWLAVLHFTWPNVDLSENTSIFIYGAYISPRWWATAYSMYILTSAFSLEDVLRRRTPNVQDLQDRSAMELTFYVVQATLVITATILTVDIQWAAVSVFHTRYLKLPAYQAGNSEVDLRWLEGAILVLVLYPVATALCALAWLPLCSFREAVRNYNERLDLFSKQVNQAHIGDDSHGAPCQPAKSDEKKEDEEGRELQHSVESNARKEEERSEDHDRGSASPTITSVNSLVGNDWEMVEDDLHSMDASDALAEASNDAESLNPSMGSRAACERHRRYMEIVDMIRCTDSDEGEGPTGPTPSTESDGEAGTEVELKRSPSEKPVHYAEELNPRH